MGSPGFKLEILFSLVSFLVDGASEGSVIKLQSLIDYHTLLEKTEIKGVFVVRVCGLGSGTLDLSVFWHSRSDAPNLSVQILLF